MISDLGLHFRRDGALRRRDLRLLTSALTFSLVFLLAPGVLTWMWLRSMYSLNEALTVIACGLPLAFTLHVMCSSLAVIWTRCSCMRRRQRLCGIVKRLPWPRRQRTGTRLVFAILMISGIGWMRTEGTLDWYATQILREQPYRLTLPDDFDWVAWARTLPRSQYERTAVAVALTEPTPWWRATPFPAFLASPRMAGAVFADLPEGWEDHETSRARHRERWCVEIGLTPLTCPTLPDSEGLVGIPFATDLPTIILTRAHREHCAQHAPNLTDDAACHTLFENHLVAMEEDWRTERNLALSAIPRFDLSNSDLRGADLSSAIAIRATFWRAR